MSVSNTVLKISVKNTKHYSLATLKKKKQYHKNSRETLSEPQTTWQQCTINSTAGCETPAERSIPKKSVSEQIKGV